jgi:hypothetical protein
VRLLQPPASIDIHLAWQATEQKMAKFLAWLFTSASLAIVVGFALVSLGIIVVPPAYVPWTPLNTRDAPNFLTRYKLTRLERDPAECAFVLRQADIAYTPIPDQVTGEGCGFANAVRVSRPGAASTDGFIAACPLAAALSLFDHHVVQPSARRHFGQSVSRVLHAGSYACRNINHRVGGRRSEHATANALDVTGFVLSDGTRVTVLQDWRDGARKGAFLRDLRAGACRFFDVVLSPDFNEAHRDHFHLDMGRFRACR